MDFYQVEMPCYLIFGVDPYCRYHMLLIVILRESCQWKEGLLFNNKLVVCKITAMWHINDGRVYITLTLHPHEILCLYCILRVALFHVYLTGYPCLHNLIEWSRKYG